MEDAGKACFDFFVFDEEVTPDLNVSLSLPVGIHFAKNWYRGVGLHVSDAGGCVRKGLLCIFDFRILGNVMCTELVVLFISS